MEPLLRIQDRLWEEELLAEEEPVLFCRCTLPALSRLEGAAQRRINRYYQRVEERFQRWCKRRLFSKANLLRREARSASRPFDPWTAVLSFSSEPLEGHLLSVTLDYRREQCGKNLFSKQHTDVWNLENGFLTEQ